MRDRAGQDSTIIRWIRQRAFAAHGRRRCLRQEIADKIQLEIVLNQVTGNNGMTGVPEFMDDRAAAGCGLPDVMWNQFNAQQRLYGDTRGVVWIP